MFTYDYQKVRADFGKHQNFTDFKPQAYSIGDSAADDYDDMAMAQWVKKEETTVTLDCIARYAEHEANTEKFVQVNVGSNHVDGAWPPEVKTSEFVDRQRYLRRITNDTVYQTSVMNLVKKAESAIQQNNTIDLYQDYFKKSELVEDNTEEVEYSSEPPSCRTVAVFRDPNEIKRSATKISWHPDDKNKMAISYSVLQFQQMPDKMPISSYIWDINNPNQPDAELVPQSPLVCAEYNPKSSDHLVGGCYNGLVAFWDLRKGSQPVESSILEKSHHDPVYNVFWIQSRLAQEFGSVSTDGRVLWWDARKLGDGPVDEMVLAANDTTFGGTAMEYRSDAGATKYLVGTEQGQCILADRKASKDKGSQKSIKAIYGERGRHHGPIYSIQRNPFNMKYFLTAGDWTTRIWSEDQKTQPLLTTRYSDSYLTGACWSPTRPGVFYNTKMDGTLDVWDFHYKMNDPIFTTKVGDFALSSIAVQQHGRLVAVGSEDGTTSVLEFSTGLSKMQPDEKNNIANMFERESKREKNLEMRYTQRKTLEKQKKAAPTPEFDPANPSWTDETTTAIKDAEEAFYGAIKEESGDKAEAGEEEKAAEE